MGEIMRRFRVTLPILTACVALASTAAIPTASAESGCMASGQTQQYCEQEYLKSSNSVRAAWGEGPSIYGTEDGAAAIAQGYRIVDRLVANPTADGFNSALNAWLHTFQSDDHCMPGSRGTPTCTAMPATPEQVAFLLNTAVRWLGPPGLEQTLNQALTVPG